MTVADSAIRILRTPRRLAEAPSATELANRDQCELDLEFLLPTGVPAVPRARLAIVRSTPPPETVQDRSDDDLDDFGECRRTSSHELPDPAAWAARLAQAIVEVRAGLRPPHQLSRWTTHTLLARLRRAHAASDRRAMISPRVRSVHVGQPADGIAEASAVVAGRDRSHAIALRLEGWDGRWLCTAADVV